MKKLLAIAICVTCVSQAASAKDNVGCGLGSVIFSGQKGLVFDLAASFTNGIFLNQAFGMTTGTLGCQPNARIERRELAQYINANYEQLAYDAATGEAGEATRGAAVLLNVDSKQLAKAMNENFDSIFGNGNDSNTATDAIYSMVL